jgi:DegV family protein with EDD domain
MQMSGYILSCCSTADLSKHHFEGRDIHYICFHFSLDGKSYPDDLGASVPFDEFYKAMAEGADTKTSQVSTGDFINYFTPFLDQGLDILHVCLSSGLSGVYNSANIAKSELCAKYPDRKIYIVDSLGASSGYGLLMDALADKRDSGIGIDELHSWVNAHRLNLHHWFFSTDLTFYVKGGRISKTAALVGAMLKICPLLNMDMCGHLIPRYKIRSKKRVIEEIVNQMEIHACDGRHYSGKCYISHSACFEDARAVANLIEARFPDLNGKVEIYNVGTVIGSHTGPGTVALFFWGDERVD